METPQTLLSHTMPKPRAPFAWDSEGQALRAVRTICEKWVENPQHSKIYVDGLNEWLRRVPEEFRLEWFLYICKNILNTLHLNGMNEIGENFLNTSPVKKLCSMSMLLGLRTKQEYVTWLISCLKHRLPTDHSGMMYVVEENFLEDLEKQLRID